MENILKMELFKNYDVKIIFRHVISLPEFSSNTNSKLPVIAALT